MVPDKEGTCLAPDSKLHYLSVYMQREKVKKQSHDRKPLPKGDKEGITIHFQSNTHSFWPGALWPAFHYGIWKSNVQYHPTLHPNVALPPHSLRVTALP